MAALFEVYIDTIHQFVLTKLEDLSEERVQKAILACQRLSFEVGRGTVDMSVECFDELLSKVTCKQVEFEMYRRFGLSEAFMAAVSAVPPIYLHTPSCALH